MRQTDCLSVEAPSFIDDAFIAIETTTSMKHLTGSCLCGNVQIRVSDQFQFIGYCHCSECRKWSGSAFATGGMVGSGDLEITSGEELK